MTEQDLLDLHERISALAALVKRGEERLEALEAQRHSDTALVLATRITCLSAPWRAAVTLLIDTMIAEKQGGSGATDRETP